jgi:hypothetical protein
MNIEHTAPLAGYFDAAFLRFPSQSHHLLDASCGSSSRYPNARIGPRHGPLLIHVLPRRKLRSLVYRSSHL